LIVAVITTPAQMAAIWAVWRWLLPELGIRLETWVLICALCIWLFFCIFLFISGTRALKVKEYAGLSTMVGLTGKAAGRLAPDGMVKIKDELWQAAAQEGIIEDGEKITVVGENGLKLMVKKAV
jgi:membrane-bound serine protease (ClpP class)